MTTNPEDWQLVPKDLPDAMFRAGVKALAAGHNLQIAFDDMLAAAPAPPGDAKVGELRGSSREQQQEHVERGDEIGRRVKKVTGDYRFAGEVRAVFTKRNGVVRYVVENSDGILHIFNAANIVPIRSTDADDVTREEPRSSTSDDLPSLRATNARLWEALEAINSWRDDRLGKPEPNPSSENEAFQRGVRMAFYRCSDRARAALAQEGA